MKKTTFFGATIRNVALTAGFVFLVAGCGSSGVPPYIPAAAPGVQTVLTISGTAASGRAIAGATVSAKCKAGTGVTTTNVDGSFSLDVAGGQLTCMLEIVKPADGSKLHTLVIGSAGSATANITPLTEMLTARVLRGDPASFFGAFDPAALTRTVTPATVAAAQTDVRTALVGTVDTTALDDFISTPLSAATQDNISGGDAQDKMLDTIGARFNASRLAQVVAAMAGTSNATDLAATVAALAAPLANAGAAQNVALGATVALNGGASSATAGRTLSYVWSLTTKPAGSSATLAAANSAQPTFEADIAGAYVASLKVNDGSLDSDAATVTITASATVTTPVSPMTFLDNADGTVTDPATGLTWMRCSMGMTWDGSACSGTADTYTWDNAGILTGTVTFAGQSDWRLPNMRELQTILDRTKFNPAIDTTAFPDFPSSSFWSSTAYPGVSTGAWYVNFGGGDVHGADIALQLKVRLVRAGLSPGMSDSGRPASDFVDNGDGSVSHTPSGLMWKRCAEGQAWDGTTCTGTASALSWHTAALLTGTTFAAKSDWRVPTAQELEALVGYSADTIASVFPNPPFSLFWSASIYAGDPNSAWGLGFGDGECYIQPQADSFAIRLVRTR